VKGAIAWIREPLAEILDQPWFDFVLRLTVLLLMFYATRTHELRMTLRIVGCAMLFSERLLHSETLWFTLFALLAATIGLEWYRADNHYWLIAYWTAACGLAVGMREGPGQMLLRINGRMLIGLCMLFAAIWKVIGLQYFDGHFFLFQFEFDGRFQFLTQLLGEPDALHHYNNKVLGNLKAATQQGNGYVIGYTTPVYVTAVAFGWWTIFIEGLIALAFLSPYPRWLHTRRDQTLLLFIFTTYLLAPVLGFGTILIVMGLAQSDPDRWKTRAAYLVSAAVLHLGNVFTKLAVDKIVE
jgi:hypothetical protein